VGIGGIGMSGIAELLINWVIESSVPISRNLILPSLSEMGAKIASVINRKHCQSRCGSHFVGRGSDNVEVLAARHDFIPVIPRAEMLAELMRLKYSVAVAGAHARPHHFHGGHHPGRGRPRFDLVIAVAWTVLVPTPVWAAETTWWPKPTKATAHSSFCHLLLPWSPISISSTWITTVTWITSGNILALSNRVPFNGSAVLCLEDRNVQA
jgi:hypothetical protein